MSFSLFTYSLSFPASPFAIFYNPPSPFAIFVKLPSPFAIFANLLPPLSSVCLIPSYCHNTFQL